MFKLVVLFALLALATARPSGVLAPAVYTTAVVGSVPTSISHQSSAIVHRAALVTPVVHAAPLVEAAPFVAAGPVISAYSAPALIGHGYGYLAHH